MFLLPKVLQRYEVIKDCKIMVGTRNKNVVTSMILRGWPSIYAVDRLINSDGNSNLGDLDEIELDIPAGCIFKISRIHISQYHDDYTMNIAAKENSKFLLNSLKIDDIIRKYYPNAGSYWSYKFKPARINIDLNRDSLIDLECTEYNG